MTPILLSTATATTLTALFGLFIALSFRIIQLRFRHKVGTGDGDVMPLHLAIRVHGNFSEWVPFALLGIVCADLQGASDTVLWALGGTLVGARLSHAIGLSRSRGTSVFRASGVAGTITVLLVSAYIVLSASLGPA